MHTTLHVLQALGIIAYLIYVISEIKKGRLTGGQRWAAFALLGVFTLCLVANIEGW